MEIKEISAEQTWPIRHQVMWPDKDLSYVKVAEDALGEHLGLFEGERLVSIISLFREGTEVQFRKFATLRDYQGKGLGTHLLEYVFAKLKQENTTRIWCNARADKTSFYERFDMKRTDHTFEKGGITFVIMECLTF